MFLIKYLLFQSQFRDQLFIEFISLHWGCLVQRKHTSLPKHIQGIVVVISSHPIFKEEQTPLNLYQRLLNQVLNLINFINFLWNLKVTSKRISSLCSLGQRFKEFSCKSIEHEKSQTLFLLKNDISRCAFRTAIQACQLKSCCKKEHFHIYTSRFPLIRMF